MDGAVTLAGGRFETRAVTSVSDAVAAHRCVAFAAPSSTAVRARRRAKPGRDEETPALGRTKKQRSEAARSFVQGVPRATPPLTVASSFPAQAWAAFCAVPWAVIRL